MNNSPAYKVVNGFSYLSIFFLPILFPVIVWLLAGENREMRHHAAKAFWLHLIPVVMMFIFVILLGSLGIMSSDVTNVGWLALIMVGVLAIASFALVIYNVVLAVKIFIS